MQQLKLVLVIRTEIPLADSYFGSDVALQTYIDKKLSCSTVTCGITGEWLGDTTMITCDKVWEDVPNAD